MEECALVACPPVLTVSSCATPPGSGRCSQLRSSIESCDWPLAGTCGRHRSRRHSLWLMHREPGGLLCALELWSSNFHQLPADERGSRVLNGISGSARRGDEVGATCLRRRCDSELWRTRNTCCSRRRGGGDGGRRTC
jgi:hypothetical protein